MMTNTFNKVMDTEDDDHIITSDKTPVRYPKGIKSGK